MNEVASRTAFATTPSLGVVIVSWNVRDLLARCLYSLFAELKRYQLEARVVVVDNASFDNSPDMIRTQFPQVELIAREDNLGFAKGNNLGIRTLGLSHTYPAPMVAPLPTDAAGKGGEVLLLNPDTEVQSGAIKTLLDVCTPAPIPPS